MLTTRTLIRMLSTRSSVVREATTSTTGSPPHPTDSTESKGGQGEEVKEERKTEAKLVVFGGNGFVGSRVCEEGLKMGLRVISVNRSGRPAWLTASWADGIEWIHGDALQPASYIDHLRDALGAVSCVGGFGSNAVMYRICGTANVNIIETAASVEVPRFAFVSVHHDTLPSLIKQIGYFKGKIEAEAALMRCFGSRGVSLRPFFIHGTRQLTASLGIPLQFVGMPLERVLNWLPNNKQLATSIPILGTGLIPPVKVRSVAKAAVAAATDPSIEKSVLDVWDIAKY